MEQAFHPYFFLPPDQDPRVRSAERKNLSRIFLSLLFYLLVASFLQAAFSFVAAHFFPAFYESEAYLWIAHIVPSYMIALPLIFLMLSTLPKKVPEKGHLSPRENVLFLAISFAFVYVGQLVALYVSEVLEFIKGDALSSMLEEYVAEFSPLMTLVIMVLLAPIFEELLFRKLIIDRLLPYSQRLAVLLSGLLFGLVHGNFEQFFYAFFVGIIFGYVYVKTGRLIYTILMHMIINFTGSFIAEAFNELINSEAALSNSINPWSMLSGIYSVAMLVLVVAGLILFILNLKKFKLKSEGDRGLTLKTQFSLAFCNTGMILFLIVVGITFISSIFI